MTYNEGKKEKGYNKCQISVKRRIEKEFFPPRLVYKQTTQVCIVF
jgi:hypothetical protein